MNKKFILHIIHWIVATVFTVLSLLAIFSPPQYFIAHGSLEYAILQLTNLIYIPLKLILSASFTLSSFLNISNSLGLIGIIVVSSLIISTFYFWVFYLIKKYFPNKVIFFVCIFFVYLMFPILWTQFASSRPEINACLDLKEGNRFTNCIASAMYNFSESYRKVYNNDLEWALTYNTVSIDQVAGEIIAYCKRTDKNIYDGFGSDLLQDISTGYSNEEFCITAMASQAYVNISEDILLPTLLCNSLESHNKTDACLYFQNILRSSAYMTEGRQLENCNLITDSTLVSACKNIVTTQR